MSAETQSAADDLAFLRALVTAGDDGQRQFGEVYFAAGACYGVQMLLHAAQFFHILPGAGLPALVIGFGPTVVFGGVMFLIVRRHLRRQKSIGPTMVGRTLGAVFGAAGLANLALVAVIGSVAWREKSVTVWLIYPCAVFILQGAAWFVSYALRRRPWHGLVGAGWIVSALGMAAFITDMPMFILFTSIGILGCMALPGWVMMRQAGKAV